MLTTTPTYIEMTVTMQRLQKQLSELSPGDPEAELIVKELRHYVMHSEEERDRCQAEIRRIRDEVMSKYAREALVLQENADAARVALTEYMERFRAVSDVPFLAGVLISTRKSGALQLPVEKSPTYRALAEYLHAVAPQTVKLEVRKGDLSKLLKEDMRLADILESKYDVTAAPTTYISIVEEDYDWQQYQKEPLR